MLPRLSGLEVLRKMRGELSLQMRGELSLQMRGELSLQMRGELSSQMRGDMRDGISADIPVILVTARGETVDKVDGLNSGADDYIAKPFKIEELLARINAVLRRAQKTAVTASVPLTNGAITMIADKMKVTFNETAVELSKNEFLLLKYFLENVGKVLGRDEIIKTVWGENYFIEENSVDVYVRHLRAKFGDSVIKTVRGMGYTMQEHVC
ncbi:MAG: response regulator transcription factor [Treponema sp.]|nr:response regulator transcription factor [Treponema sp.]